MPLPFIIGGAAAAAAAAGIGSAASGAKKMKDANEKSKYANEMHKRIMARFEANNKSACVAMDDLGKLELDILKGFGEFSDLIEKIQNRPQFKEINREGVKIPEYNGEELRNASIGAGVLLGGLGGAAVGTAGGFAAAGVTTSAVMALGTASTGTAIAQLSGAAATNATLAALGGGPIGSAAYAGGMALGSTILGAATLGVGLMIGGIIFNLTGSSISEKADEKQRQVKSEEDKVNVICSYLSDLERAAIQYHHSLEVTYEQYKKYYNEIFSVVNDFGVVDWDEFSEDEKMAAQNAVLMVGILYKMCKVNLVLQGNKEDEMNSVNKQEINKAMDEAKKITDSLAA